MEKRITHLISPNIFFNIMNSIPHQYLSPHRIISPIFTPVKNNPRHTELKKSLGQHFLHDKNMLQKISTAIGDLSRFKRVIEVGPGMGALTALEITKKHPHYTAVEIDRRWAEHLSKTFPPDQLHLIQADFLKTDLSPLLDFPSIVIGNFPYNISSQILFHLLQYADKVDEVVGMFQKEVGLRVAAPPGNKDYGVISVLIQAYYDVSYLFDVPPGCFSPPPKVMSGIIRLKRKTEPLPCDPQLFRQIVKTVFQQRRKTLRNGLKNILSQISMPDSFTADAWFTQRPEQLSLQDFVQLTLQIQNGGKKTTQE